MTGLASGKIGPSGWPWVMVAALLAISSAGVILMGIGGAALLVDLANKKQVTDKKEI